MRFAGCSSSPVTADRGRRPSDVTTLRSTRRSVNVLLVTERWFLKIDGIIGESKDARHKGEIDVVSWSFGVSNSGTAAVSGGGGRAGKASFQDLHFVSKISKASPNLFLSCATGSHHKSALLSGVKTGSKDASSEFLKYKLSDVIVTSNQHTDGQGSSPMETFSLNYSKIEITYTPQSATGKPATPVHTAFDVKSSKEF